MGAIDNMTEIEAMAKSIVASQSFEYKTFSEAKAVIYNSDKSKNYVYDRLSLCMYKHSLDAGDYNSLGKEIRQLFNTRDSETKKARIEYAVLFHYAKLYPHLQTSVIEKKIRPDFIMTTGKEKCGIEVTELTTPHHKLLDRIASDNFGRGLTADEIKGQAKAKHGKKFSSYLYWQLENTAVIGSGEINVDAEKAIYVQEILKKYALYKSEMCHYDQFIILCNAQHSICVTSPDDADDIWNALKLNHFEHRFTVAILATTNSGALCCYNNSFSSE